MFLQEPPASPWELRFRLGPFPVRVHPFFWLLALLLGQSLREPLQLASWVGVCFVSILIHELGHALAHRYFGYSSRIVLYSMGGLAIREGGWARRHLVNGGPRISEWLEQVIISAAGPLAGFLLAAFVAVLVLVSRGQIVVVGSSLLSWTSPRVELPQPALSLVASLLLQVNIGWGILNLMPVVPLDGGQIMRALLCRGDSWTGNRRAHLASVVIAGALAYASLVLWKQTGMGVMFGYLAVNNYLALQGSGSRW